MANRNGRQQRGLPRHLRQTMSGAGRYARALIRGEESVIDEMTLYTNKGGAGAGDPSSLKDATDIHSIMAKGNTATVLFSDSNGEVSSCGVFTVLDRGNKVQSDWKIFS